MKNINYNILKKKLILLYLLNVSDILFTYILLDSNLFYEGNNIMARIISNKSIGIFLKCVVVLVLIIYICFRLKKASINQIKVSNILINIIVIAYVAINIGHILGISLIINM